MDQSTVALVLDIFHYLFFAFSVLVISSYILLSVISAKETVAYFRKKSFVNYKEILASKMSPSISILAPAYNESVNIVENVRSLLSNHYANYE